MKLLALKLGPDQFGLVGQVMTVIAIVSMFAGGGITNGLIRYVAINSDSEKRKPYLGAGFSILVISSLMVGCLLVFFSGILSSFLFQESKYAYLFWCLAVAQIFIGANNLALALLSATGDIRTNVVCTIGGGLLGTALFYGAFAKGDLDGAVIGLLLFGAVPALFSVTVVMRKHLVPVDSLRLFRDGLQMRELLSYSIVMLVAVSAVPVAHILIRNHMGAVLGWEVVGYWQGLIKLSDVFMQFAGVILINFALPRYAAADSAGLDKELRQNLLVMVTVFSCIYAIFYLMRNVAVVLIFSPEYLPVGRLLPGQLVGDIFRIAAVTISYVFLAKGYRVIPIFSELTQGIGLLVLTMMFMPACQELAPIYAHLTVYSILFLSMAAGYHLWSVQQAGEVKK